MIGIDWKGVILRSTTVTPNPTLLRLSSFGLIWPHPDPTTLSVVRAQLKLELGSPGEWMDHHHRHPLPPGPFASMTAKWYHGMFMLIYFSIQVLAGGVNYPSAGQKKT